jgi:hypothetical protein
MKKEYDVTIINLVVEKYYGIDKGSVDMSVFRQDVWETIKSFDRGYVRNLRSDRYQSILNEIEKQLNY